MGRDKAFLEIDGEPLWQRQLATLRRLTPEQLMISGPCREEWREYEIVADEVAGAGPLAGLAAALRQCATPRLVILAIDLPEMTPGFLHSLLQSCGEHNGVVPRRCNRFEPLAAVYPAECVALAEAALRDGDFSMQRFVRRAQEQHLLLERAISDAETVLFANLNTPADL
jgi:molybdopterin-guanine dinucleotide biosynthesis protein A